MKIRKVVNFPCPPQAPEGWEVYNAPRPLEGTTIWMGKFIGGIFFAAIDPADPDADLWREENRRLAAVRLEFVSRQSVIDEMVAYYRDKYSPEQFEKIFTEHPLKDEETQKMLVDTWFNLEMNWEERS
jgi:hypothetical protein